MSYRSVLIALCFPCLIALPIWTYNVHRGLDEMLRGLDEPGRTEFWFGLVGMIASVVILECGLRFSSEMWDEEQRKLPPDKPVPKVNPLTALQWCWLISIHLSGLMVFATTMDGGMRWAATRWVYLGYAIPALVLLALRWKRWSLFERLFLRWGWAPVLAFGVPIAFPKLLASGLIDLR